MLRSLAPLLLIAILAAATGAGFVGALRDPADSPVADINHAIHIERDLECADCHTGVATHAAAGVPGIKVCAECHGDPEDAIARTENGKRIVEHVRTGEELWWPQLYDLPGHVVFSHRRHVKLGGIACEKCHGDIAKTTTLPEEPVEETLTMDGCLECHARSGVSQDCFACHK